MEFDMRWVVLGSILIVGAVLFGCVSQPSAQATPTPVPTVQGASGEGGVCGGVASLKCAAGLDCKYFGFGLLVSHESVGVCVAAPVQTGSACGGLMARKCSSGEKCSYAGYVYPQYPDQAGSCVSSSTPLS